MSNPYFLEIILTFQNYGFCFHSFHFFRESGRRKITSTPSGRRSNCAVGGQSLFSLVLSKIDCHLAVVRFREIVRKLR